MLLCGVQASQDPKSLHLHLAVLNLNSSNIPKLKARPFAWVRKNVTERHAVSIQASGQFRFAQHLTYLTLQHPVSTAVIDGQLPGDKGQP